MTNSLNIRIKQLIDELGLSQAEFAERLGIYPSRVSNVVKGKNKPDAEFLSVISDKFKNVNLKWLLSGDGEILISEQKGYNTLKSEITVVAEPEVKYGTKKQIPLIPIDAVAGLGFGDDFVISEKDVESRYIIPEFNKVDFLIRVRGSSMYPKFYPGDLLGCRRVQNHRLIEFNKAYVIDTSEGILVKRILKSLEKENWWILRSDNQEYQDMTINPVEDVRSINKVVGVIRLEG